MEQQPIASETNKKGRNSLSNMIRMFNSGKTSDQDSKERLLKPIKDSKKNVKQSNIEKSPGKDTEPTNITQQVPIEEKSSNQESKDNKKKTNSEKNPEQQSETKDIKVPIESANEVNTTEINIELEQTNFDEEPPTESIPTEMTPEDLQPMRDVNSIQTIEENVSSVEPTCIKSDQEYIISEKPNANVDHIQVESSPTTQDDSLQDHAMQSPPHSNVQPNLQKKSPVSAMSLREKRQSSSKSSQSSLYSSGPSSSSLCHLTELSQPKPEALRTTLRCLRQLHGKNAEQLVSIERHLRGLRSGPKTKPESKSATNTVPRKKVGILTGSQTKPSKSNVENASGERQAFDKFAANLFAQLERKRALENYEASNLPIPVEMGYYRAAYDALVQAFGQPYHKCTLELYQQLAAELGMEAEMFVMDKTPTVVT